MSTSKPLTTPHNPDFFFQQSNKLTKFSFFCIPGFLIIMLTAILPFNFFTHHDKTQQDILITYTPLALGVSFLLAMTMCLLALILLLGSTDLKKNAVFYSRNKNLEEKLQRQTKRLRWVRMSILLLFILASGINIFLNIATYFFNT